MVAGWGGAGGVYAPVVLEDAEVRRTTRRTRLRAARPLMVAAAAVVAGAVCWMLFVSAKPDAPTGSEVVEAPIVSNTYKFGEADIVDVKLHGTTVAAPITHERPQLDEDAWVVIGADGRPTELVVVPYQFIALAVLAGCVAVVSGLVGTVRSVRAHHAIGAVVGHPLVEATVNVGGQNHASAMANAGALIGGFATVRVLARSSSSYAGAFIAGVVFAGLGWLVGFGVASAMSSGGFDMSGSRPFSFRSRISRRDTRAARTHRVLVPVDGPQPGGAYLVGKRIIPLRPAH